MPKSTSEAWVVMRGNIRGETMTEEQVRDVAEKFVVDQALDKCVVVAVRRFKRQEIEQPTTLGDEWVVQFQFESDDEISANYACVVIDDATGEPQLFESL
jgi:hypothetical protein